jgi:integrase
VHSGQIADKSPVPSFRNSNLTTTVLIAYRWLVRMRKKKGRNEKGLGTLTPRGKTGDFYLRVKINGKEYTHATGTSNLEAAKLERERFLKTIRPSLSNSSNDVTKVTVSELLDDYIDHLRSGGKKDAKGIAQIIEANLRPPFVGRLAVSVTTQDGKNYRAARLASDGVQDSTVNKELKYLIAAYNHGREQTPKKVIDTPYLPMEAVSNVRRGFIDVQGYRDLLKTLPASLKLFLVLAFHGANRFSEITGLKRSQVNRRLGVIELQQTKNGEDRNLPIYGDMAAWLDRQEQVHQAECPECEFVLFWYAEDISPLHLKVEPGTKLGRFDKTWKRAAKAAGFPGLLAHDLRRSGVRNMIQEAGLTEAHAMLISGHKTRAMLERYNIVSLKGIQESGKKLDAWMKDATAKAEEQERIRPVAFEPEPLTMKQRVRELFYVQEATVEEIMKTLDIAESTVYYHLSGHRWGKKTASTALQVQS